MRELKPPVILHLSQDDPKKCTARKLARFDLAHIVVKMDMLPYSALLLDPFSGIAFSPADRDVMMEHGLAAVDCSWEHAEEIFPKVRKNKKVVGRTLPLLLACNPTKFGKWGELSTLEALAAACFIAGESEYAKRMLSIYTWGEKFLEINREPLEAYSKCKDSREVVEVQKEFI